MLKSTFRLSAGGKNPITNVLSNHVFYYPTPSHLTYNWSFGSLVGLFFALQIVTGVILAMHYTPHIEYAFASVEHIMVDVGGGYLFRYFHANGASAVFILMYLHIARNLYYQSYLTRRALWYTGLAIFLLMMATAFIGYVLPWGQMSFWGATVITSLVTAVPFIGEDVAYWVWGGFSINNATLTRFFSLHYLLPFLITGLIGIHLVLLHTDGSNDPLVLSSSPDKLTFHPYFSYKDAFIFFGVFAAFAGLVCYFSNLLGHSDNFLPANPLVTPAHIVPEWYFTPFYAILRACPNKLGGAIGMFAAILLLFSLPFYIDAHTTLKHVFSPYADPHKTGFWIFIGIFLTLMFLGSRAAAAPYVGASKLFTGLYFGYFLIVLPTLGWTSNQLARSGTSREYSKLFFSGALLDAPTPWQMNFQVPSTEVMEKIVDLHQDIMFFLILIVTFVSWMLLATIVLHNNHNFSTSRAGFAHRTPLEKMWSYIPVAALILIAAPSFYLLYSIDDSTIVEPKIALKYVGGQWYCSYETTNIFTARDIDLDSYLVADDELRLSGLHLFEINERAGVPAPETPTSVEPLRADVFHNLLCSIRKALGYTDRAPSSSCRACVVLPSGVACPAPEWTRPEVLRQNFPDGVPAGLQSSIKADAVKHRANWGNTIAQIYHDFIRWCYGGK